MVVRRPAKLSSVRASAVPVNRFLSTSLAELAPQRNFRKVRRTGVTRAVGLQVKCEFRLEAGVEVDGAGEVGQRLLPSAHRTARMVVLEAVARGSRVSRT